MLTFVMYHYVRPLRGSTPWHIRGRDVASFAGQLDYIMRHYTVVGLRDVLAARRGETELPFNACALTFDDGLRDHYEHAFPLLRARGLTASFFVPARPLLENIVLDVHKIHFLLATVREPRHLVADILRELQRYRPFHQLPSDAELYQRYAVASRFDPPEVIFIKRVLQRGLPKPVRAAITDALFSRWVTADEKGFGAELYLDFPRIDEMLGDGMEFGGHSVDHEWFDDLDQTAVEREVGGTVEFLERLHGARPLDWFMSYPYGAWSDVAVDVLRREHCALALSTEVALVDDLSAPFTLPRLDTNDLPLSASAPVSPWTELIHAQRLIQAVGGR
jgi:peptidoglycan/xylan/chitin deacetylase (PgdA/CDA1 family)